MSSNAATKGRPPRDLHSLRSFLKRLLAVFRRGTLLSQHRRQKRAFQELDDIHQGRVVENESDFSTFEEFRLFALEYLERISERPGDTEDLALVSEVFSKYQTVFKKMWPGTVEGAGWDEAEPDVYLLQCLERTSNFITRLRNRNDLSEVEEGRLLFVSRILHRCLRDRVKKQLPYRYLPLQYNPETRVAEIRVLHLLSGPGDGLQCLIEHGSIAAIPFIALSYEWGDSDQLFSIEVTDIDGQSLGNIPLTANLYNALCNLRDSSEVKMQSFWVDQISINQGDRVERGHQVDMMGKIYAAAAQVISYLGPGEASDSEAFGLLDRIEKQFGHLYDSPMLYDGLNSTRDLYEFQKQIPEELILVDDAPDAAWRNLSRLVFGPWTRRLWMVQETCLNPAEDGVVLMRGSIPFPFTKVVAVQTLNYVGLIPDGPLHRSVDQMMVALLCWIRRGGKTGRGSNTITDLAGLLALLANSAQCSDPRDRVFALLGLADDAKDLEIVADYHSKSYSEVLHNVSIRMMSQPPHKYLLEPLKYWQSDNIGNALRLPSWVCRWPSLDNKPSILPAFKSATQWSGPVSFSADNLRLKLRGLHVGCVQQNLPTSGKSLNDNLTSSDLDRFESMLVTAKLHLDKHQPTPRAILINTILAAKEGESLSQDACDQVFEFLLKLIVLAKAHLQDRSVEHGIELLSAASFLSPDQQQLARNVIMRDCLDFRSLCLIDGHRISLAPQHTQAGDLVVAFRGGKSLYIVRSCGKDYYYIGDAYVYGLMNGELMEKNGWKKSIEKFSLI